MENSPKRKKRPFFVDATVAQISDDFKSRRAGIVKALTTEVGKFYRKCDPGKENLALFGFPGEKWRVAAPKEVAPSDFPEPVVGINFARDGMRVNDWLSLIAAHSDAWLLANAFYHGTKARFTKAQRKRLFTKINKLPSVLEVLKGTADGKARAKILNAKSKGKKYKRALKVKEDLGNGEEESLCGACGERSGWGQFWICCDTCKTWFHGQCVKITSARAEHIKRYKCPVCKSKRARHSYI